MRGRYGIPTILTVNLSSLIQRAAALNPHIVAMPSPVHVPKALRSYYASLTLEPDDILSFAYQIASGMVSRDHRMVVCDSN